MAANLLLVESSNLCPTRRLAFLGEFTFPAVMDEIATII